MKYPMPPVSDLDLTLYARNATLRDYFAAKAMQSLASDNHTDRSKTYTQKNIAELAYQLADAMLKARKE